MDMDANHTEASAHQSSAINGIDHEYDAIADTYDRGYHGPIWQVYDRITWNAIESILPPKPGKVIDLGAGTGKFALKVAALGHHVTLIEPSLEMLNRARTRFRKAGLMESASFVQGALPAIETKSDQFDAAICEGDPLSYCHPRHHEAAQEILRILKPGCSFYVSCDSRWYTAVAWFCQGKLNEARRCIESGRISDPYGIGVHAFTPDELSSVFEEAGAEDIRIAGKVVAGNLMEAEHLARVIKEHGLDRVTRMEEEFGASRGLMGFAGHLTITGCKPRQAATLAHAEPRNIQHEPAQPHEDHADP